MCQGTQQDTRQSKVSAPTEFTLLWGEQTINKINKLYIIFERISAAERNKAGK